MRILGVQSASEVPWKVRGFFSLAETKVKKAKKIFAQSASESAVKVRGVSSSFVNNL